MSRLGVLGQRPFALLFLARTVSVLGNGFTAVALAFAVLQASGTASDVGIVLAARALPLLLLLVFGGVVADRLPRQAVMRVANLLSALSQGALAVLLITHHADLAELAGLSAVGGAATAFFFPASTGVVPQTVDGADLQAANALLAASTNTATIVGAGLAGGLVAVAGPGWAIAVDAVSYAGAAVALAFLHLPGSAVAAARPGLVRELRGGWREFSRRRWVWVVVTQFAIVNACDSGATNVLGPIVARDRYGGARGWGLVLAADGLGTVVGSLLTARRRWHRPVLVAEIGVVVSVLPVLALAVPAPLPLVVAAAVVAGVGVGVFGVLWESALQRHVPAGSLSRVSAYDAVGSFAAIPIGLAAAGPLSAVLGLRATLLGAAALGLAVTIGALATPAVRQDDSGLGRISPLGPAPG